MIITNLIIGFLGVGKTTFIKELIKLKPENEKWVLLINEFGEVGVDAALLENDQEVQMKEIAGGCICCSAALSLKVTLNEIIRLQKPDRIIVEPTGLGHPAGIVDLIQKDFNNELVLHAIVGLVDVNYLNRDKVMTHSTFTDQVQLADIIVSTKTDISEEFTLKKYTSWVKSLFPPKQEVLSNKMIDFSILNKPRRKVIPSIPISKHLLRKDIQTYQNDSFGMYGVGLVFDVGIMFDYDSLLEYLNNTKGIERIKGVFNTSSGWYSYNRTADQFAAFFPSSYRKDSRVEILSAYPLSKEQLKNNLEKVIKLDGKK